MQEKYLFSDGGVQMLWSVTNKLTNKDLSLSPNFTPASPLIHPFQVSMESDVLRMAFSASGSREARVCWLGPDSADT